MIFNQHNWLYTAPPAAAAAPQMQRHTMPASDDTWRTEMKCAFPGPTVTRCCSCGSKELPFELNECFY